MKIKIEIDEGLPEDEVLIRCRGLTEQIADVQKAVSEVINTSQKFVFYRGNTEYYLTLDEILFFETDSDGINAHTRDNIYQTKYKLYELEELLPGPIRGKAEQHLVLLSHPRLQGRAHLQPGPVHGAGIGKDFLEGVQLMLAHIDAGLLHSHHKGLRIDSCAALHGSRVTAAQTD